MVPEQPEARPERAAPPMAAGVRDALEHVIAARRDVRSKFLSDPLPEALMRRLLEAAHLAPSVGLMQPWRFLWIAEGETRERVRSLFERANREAAESYGDGRAEAYSALKLEGLLDCAINLCVLCDTRSTQGHGLGRRTWPETMQYSCVAAVQNLWLTARAEGVGVGWVSILDPQALAELLQLPAGVEPVAYLCLGFVESFGDEPELQAKRWERRAPLEEHVFRERFEG
jgi:5,6-dimethylbenzimidazole synthase